MEICYLNYLDFISLFIACFLIQYDAKKLKEYNEIVYEEEIKMSPAGLTIASLLFFIIFAPFYLFKRKKYFDKISLHNESEKKINDDVTLKITGNLTVILILYLILSTILSIFFFALSYALSPLQDPLFQGVILGILSNAVFIFLIFYFLKIKNNVNLLNYLHINKTENILLFSFILPIVGGLFLATLNIFISTSNFSSFSSTSPMSNALFQSTAAGMVTFMLFALIVAPLLEEIIFRGYIFTSVSRIKGKYFALIFVTLLFAFMHVDQNWGDFVAILLVFLVGLFITLLRLYTKSVIPCITSHYVYNIAIIILPTLYMSFYNPSYLQYMKNQDSIRFEEKETLLLKSIEEQPRFTDAYNALAWTYAENEKRLDQGLFLIEKAIELKPGNIYYLDTKAEILYKMKRYDEAIEIEISLTERAPDFEFFKDQLEKFKKAKEEENNEDNPYPL